MTNCISVGLVLSLPLVSSRSNCHNNIVEEESIYTNLYVRKDNETIEVYRDLTIWIGFFPLSLERLEQSSIENLLGGTHQLLNDHQQLLLDSTTLSCRYGGKGFIVTLQRRTRLKNVQVVNQRYILNTH